MFYEYHPCPRDDGSHQAPRGGLGPEGDHPRAGRPEGGRPKAPNHPEGRGVNSHRPEGRDDTGEHPAADKVKHCDWIGAGLMSVFTLRN